MNSERFHKLPVEPAPTASKTSDSAAGLSRSYGRDRLVALLRDPHCIWLYWESAASGPAEIRLYYAKDRRLASKTSCRLENANYYLSVEESGQTYYAELCAVDSGRSLLRSNPVTLPYGYPTDALPDQVGSYNGSLSSGRTVSSWRSFSSAIFSRRAAVYSKRSS